MSKRGRKKNAIPTLRLPILMCPGCRSEELEIHGSHTLADGNRCRYYSCSQCGQKFRVVLVVPPVPRLPAPAANNFSNLPSTGKSAEGR